MQDFSIEDWKEYIKSHLSEFLIQEFEPDKYGLWHVNITSKRNRHYSEYYEDADKDVAIDKAINRLASVLYQYYLTPEKI